MSFFKKHFDFALLALVISGFVYVATERLADVPLPDSDESMTLQVPYEMLNHGKLAFPMYRFLGGDIENSWHSYTPVFFVIASGFMKVFGWGLTQARAFNVATTVLLLLIVYLLARKLFDWQAGLVTVVLLISDPLFLARSRLARNDMLAAAFGLLAVYLYEKAEGREGKRLYLISGLAAGAGVMCHTNLLYVLCAIGALILVKHRRRTFKIAAPYCFAAGAMAVMAYEIVSDIVDYQNFVLQNRKDDLHFRVLENWGWWHNLLAEPARYAQWFDARGARIAPQVTLLHIFLLLTALSIVFLLARVLIQMKRGEVIGEPRIRVLVVTGIVVVFFAVVTQRKVTQYVVHLAPWFALCAGIALTDATAMIGKLRRTGADWARSAYLASVSIVALVIAFYGYELVKQNRQYLAEVRNPDLATFDEVAAALRSIVPEDVCPVSIASAYLWLAFPEQDRCYFAFTEARLDEPLELDGKDYALIMKPKFEDRLKRLTGAGPERYHLLGEMNTTALGTFYVYYTGADPKFLALAPKRYYFFGQRRGYVSGEQLSAAREVWSASGAELGGDITAGSMAAADDPDEQQSASAGGKLVSLASVELDADSIYQLSAVTRPRAECELLIVDDSTGAVIQRIQADQAPGGILEGVFKTESSKRIRLAARLSGSPHADPMPISRISIRAVGPA